MRAKPKGVKYRSLTARGGTLAGAEVDQAGCSLTQYCTAIDAGTKIGARALLSNEGQFVNAAP